jgi:hypothetical protein
VCTWCTQHLHVCTCMGLAMGLAINQHAHAAFAVARNICTCAHLHVCKFCTCQSQQHRACDARTGDVRTCTSFCHQSVFGADDGRTDGRLQADKNAAARRIGLVLFLARIGAPRSLRISFEGSASARRALFASRSEVA